jgi:DNA-binding LacI/PurR family transcriptional regulator
LPILTDVHNERCRFECYLEMLLDRRVEALIVVANWVFVNIDVLGDLEKNNIPTAMIGRELQAGSVSSVIVDNELGAQAAIEHLFSLGHRQIAFLRGPRHIAVTAPRWNGIRNFAKAHGLQTEFPYRSMAGLVPELLLQDSTHISYPDGSGLMQILCSTCPDRGTRSPVLKRDAASRKNWSGESASLRL